MDVDVDLNMDMDVGHAHAHGAPLQEVLGGGEGGEGGERGISALTPVACRHGRDPFLRSSAPFNVTSTFVGARP